MYGARTLLAIGLLASFSISATQAQTWRQQAKLTAPNAAENDRFGESVSLWGNRIAVGVPRDDDRGDRAGKVVVFEQSGEGIWSPSGSLYAEDATAIRFFGTSVGLQGDRLLVGQYYIDPAAYVFEYAAGSWQQVAKLQPTNQPPGDDFGWSVALEGDRAIVGAPGNINFQGNGSAYVFERNGSSDWIEVARIEASDAHATDHFGWAVALSGDYAIVGQANHTNQLGPTAAYIFERTSTGEWIEAIRLGSNIPEEEEEYGYDVAISGNRAVVSWYDFAGPGGAADVFERDGRGNWNQVTRLVSSGNQEFGDSFGYSVAVDNDRIAVGAIGADRLNMDSVGCVFVFERDDTGQWQEVAKLFAHDTSALLIGSSLSLDGDRIVSGAPWVQDFRGAAYVFEPSTCPLEMLFQEFLTYPVLQGARRASAFEELYAFRDNILSRTGEGQELKRIYYDHGGEVAWMMVQHPELGKASLNLVIDVLPQIAAANASGSATVSLGEDLWETGLGLLAQYEVYASPDFAQDLARARDILLSRHERTVGLVTIDFAAAAGSARGRRL